jgi:hypothetical protein
MSHLTTDRELSSIRQSLAVNNRLNALLILLAVLTYLFLVSEITAIKKPEAITTGEYIIN